MNIYLKSFVITVLAMLASGGLGWGLIMYPKLVGGSMIFILLYVWTLYFLKSMS